MATGLEVIATSAASGGGNLSKLPREIRDEIYSYVLKGNYIIAAPMWTLYPRSKHATRVEYADFTTILRVSKAISYEAKRVLYAESVFTCNLDLGRLAQRMEYPKEVTDGIMHVEYHICDSVYRYSEIQWPGATTMTKLCEATIGNFTGTDITRRYMKICVSPQIELASTHPLFTTLERLGGFRKIRIELRSPTPPSNKRYPKLKVMDKRLRGIEARLKSALGPAEHGHLDMSGSDAFGYHRCLTFYPHEHLMENPDLEVE